ncbi:hypothetical protein HDU76_001557 [Blyttiomyces sp. JEL0837]|nr:hypothetical protein HDU76_001557 [Blyttiomyces sp. JEL0837]
MGGGEGIREINNDDGGRNDGSQVGLATCFDNNPNQAYLIGLTTIPLPTLQTVPLVNQTSLYSSLSGDFFVGADGNYLALYSNSVANKWGVERISGGYFKLRSLSVDNFCMGADATNNSVIKVDCNTGSGRTWWTYTSPNNQTYYINADASKTFGPEGGCLTVPRSSPINSLQLVLSQCNFGKTSQMWSNVNTCPVTQAFPATVVGHSATIPCPPDQAGTQTAQCGINGVWSAPTSNCVLRSQFCHYCNDVAVSLYSGSPDSLHSDTSNIQLYNNNSGTIKMQGDGASTAVSL